jgi:hypothetical protein
MLPALIIGGYTAWFLGMRAGLIVGAAVAVALLLATFIPGMSITIYALVLAWGAALYFFGPKLSKAAGKSSLLGGLGGSVGTAKAWARKFMGGNKP